MPHLTETQHAAEHMQQLVEMQYMTYSPAEMKFNEAISFLLRSLAKISVKEECSRTTQLYWAVAPLLLLQDITSTELRIDVGDMLEDPLSLHFPKEDPNVISIYGATLLRYALGMSIPDEEITLLEAVLLDLYDQESGGFHVTPCGEIDTRTTYTALCVIFLNKLEGFDNCFESVGEFFMRRLDFGFSGSENGERHGSYTFCALAGLEILNKLGHPQQLSELQKSRLIKFLVFRQESSGGFNGRINKEEDGCYNFWIGASLCLLGAQDLVDIERFNQWVSACNQDFEDGGFRDKPGVSSDRFHNCYVLTGWWLLNNREGVDPCFPVLRK